LIFLAFDFLASIEGGDDDSTALYISLTYATGISEQEYAFINGFGLSILFIIGGVLMVCVF